MNVERVSYAGKRVYIGLDVHRTFFVASCLSEGVIVKRCRLPAAVEAVVSFIRKYFAGAEVHTCYEAGYSGFWLHRGLRMAGILNIVVHPAHVQVEANRVKTDKRDSLKLAEQLAAGRLHGIRIPSVEEEERRLITRTREQLSLAKRRVQAQIRMRLHQFGLLPAGIERVLRPKDVEAILGKVTSANLKLSIEFLYSQWLYLAAKVKELDKYLVVQTKSDPFAAVYLCTPGIGPLISRVLSNELGNMTQFPNERALFSFTGLTPGEHSSGDRICRGHISRQGSARLRYVLVEAAWKAIKQDKVLAEQFERLAARCGKKRAIVAVARKLIGRIRAAFKAHKLYEVGYKKAA